MPTQQIDFCMQAVTLNAIDQEMALKCHSHPLFIGILSNVSNLALYQHPVQKKNMHSRISGRKNCHINKLQKFTFVFVNIFVIYRSVTSRPLGIKVNLCSIYRNENGDFCKIWWTSNSITFKQGLVYPEQCHNMLVKHLFLNRLSKY